MGMTSIRRNEEALKLQEARGGRPAQPQPSSIPFSQHQAEIEALRTEFKRQLIEARAAAPAVLVAEDPRVAELTKAMGDGHVMLRDAYNAIVAGTSENDALKKRVEELEGQLVEAVGNLTSAANEHERLRTENVKLAADLTAARADLEAFESLQDEQKAPAPAPDAKATAAEAAAEPAKSGKGPKK